MELLIASLSAAVALISVALSSRASRGQVRLAAELERLASDRQRLLARHDVMTKHRDQLLWAVFDLQARIFNIVEQYFLLNYYHDGTDAERAYARTSTLYVFGEFLCWVEINRRRVQFLDLGEQATNRQIMNYFTQIGDTLRSDHRPYSDFLLWRSDQRAIGEVMIMSEGDSERSIGFAEFSERLQKDPDFAKWFRSLEVSIEEAPDGGRSNLRLVRLQHNLIDILDFLDPDFERFPEHRRRKIDKPLID